MVDDAWAVRGFDFTKLASEFVVGGRAVGEELFVVGSALHGEDVYGSGVAGDGGGPVAEAKGGICGAMSLLGGGHLFEIWGGVWVFEALRGEGR